MKSLAQFGRNRLIKNQQSRGLALPIGGALALASTPTPPCACRASRPRRDPRGGVRAPVSLPPSVTPYGLSGPTTPGKKSRTVVAPQGGRGERPLAAPENRADRLAEGVRT
jgi:hypothetical protein